MLAPHHSALVVPLVATPIQADAPYSVPQRFGLGAIMAFTTLFAIMLALIKSFDPPVWVYCYLGILGLSVCLAQMYGSHSPRAISIAVGALFMPFFLFIALWMEDFGITLFQMVMGVPCVVVFGGLVGYLMGTMAAGVFLMGDLLEQRVRGTKPVVAELVEPRPEPTAYYSPDSCTPYLGEAASQLSQSGSAMPPADDAPRVKMLGAPVEVPVYNCLALVAQRDAAGIVHVRAANLSDLRTSGGSEREALQHLVGAFKIIITQALAEGREVPILKTPHEPRPGETQRFIAVHL